ncbi:MAG: hypothetical protein R2911_30030 [Caldilineaceae bacterium]
MDARLSVGTTISVNNILRGALDYYLEASACCVVIEARMLIYRLPGFHQLMAEMAALDQHPGHTGLLYGITVGDVWQFGRLHRPTKAIYQTLRSTRFPPRWNRYCAL